jgi:MscS family membrane protein
MGVALVAWLALVSTGGAQPLPRVKRLTPDAGRGTAVEPAAVAEAPDSPRASARAFRRLTTGVGDFARAARYLSLPPGDAIRGPELARRMRVALARHLDIDFDAISPLSTGAPDDGLPPDVDKLSDIPSPDGGKEPVLLVRVRDAEGPYWAFSQRTVERVDEWYDALPDRWIRERIPERLQRFGPAGLMRWQWLGVPVLALLALVLGRILAIVSRAVLAKSARRAGTAWDGRLSETVVLDLTLLWAVAVAALLLPWLALPPPAARLARSLLGGLATLGVVWALWCAVDVWTEFLARRPGVTDNPSARSLLALLRNFAKIIVIAGGVLATLSAFGYPVATVVAGFGIGGIALAFGAQKTVENLFGSVSLAIDQPFRLGDFVKIDDFVGNVEKIGMRSTQIRTLDRTLISMPNGALSEKRIEDYASRERIRLACTIGLVYGTSREQVERVVAGIARVLRDHPRIWPYNVVVRFAGFGASSLDIEVMAWFQTADFDVFRECREDVLLGFMRVVEEAGSSFAFPTQTVHVVTEASRAPEPRGR